MNNKEKWMAYLPVVFYILGATLFISYLFVRSSLCMALGAVCVSMGAIIMTKQTKKDK